MSEALFLAADDFFSCKSGRWLLPEKGANFFDIQARLMQKPPLIGKVKFIEIPYIILRPMPDEMKAMCQRVIQLSEYVFGRGEHAVIACMEATNINYTATAEYVNHPVSAVQHAKHGKHEPHEIETVKNDRTVLRSEAISPATSEFSNACEAFFSEVAQNSTRKQGKKLS